MGLVEYAHHYYSKWFSDDKCTKKQIKDGGPKQIDQCSRRADGDLQQCYQKETNPNTGKDVYKLKNSLCSKSYESCATFSNEAKGPFINCVLSTYCGKTYKSNGLVWGATKKKIAGKIDCQDGVKKDPQDVQNA